MAGQLNLLIAVKLQSIKRFRENLKTEPKFTVNIVTALDKVNESLNAATTRIDVVVLDNALGDTHSLIQQLRKSHPQLLIVLVDEEADFAMPGLADEVSTDPLNNDELIKTIKHLFEDRRLETLRADALPSVRTFAKAMTRAKPNAKVDVAVEAMHDMGYDYVAYYTIMQTEPPSLSLAAQAGQPNVTGMAPNKLDYTSSIVGWVAENNESRFIQPDDSPNHPFVAKGLFKIGVCVPVGTTVRFGVILACKTEADSISKESALMLELTCAQLASALAREQRT